MFRRLIAALLALWLPLQLGTAFAVSAPMQAAAGHRAACAYVGPADHGMSAGHRYGAGHHGSHGHHGSPDGHASGMHVALADASATVAGALTACAKGDAHDPASCVDCAFCFASSIALVLPATSVPQAEASCSAVASRADRFDSRNQVPPDPPPIA